MELLFTINIIKLISVHTYNVEGEVGVAAELAGSVACAAAIRARISRDRISQSDASLLNR